ncbi:hypothetical protein [Nocardioides pacificus]
MSSYARTTTVLIPNTFGMPASGRALHGAGACAPALRGADEAAAHVSGAWVGIDAATTVIRERQLDASAKATANGHFPGTPAWRPPSC